MNTELQYTIREYNEERNILVVDFIGEGEGAWAEIPLNHNGNFPTSTAEIDDLVRPYATHLEVVEAKEKSFKTDKQYIRSLVGKTRSTKRFSNKAEAQEILTELKTIETKSKQTQQVNTVMEDQIEQSEKEYVKMIIEEVLKDKGLSK